MDIKTLVTEEQEKIIKDVVAYVTSGEVEKVVISNDDEYNGAGELGKKLKGMSKSIEDARKEAKEPILAAGKKIDTKFKFPKEKLDSLTTHLSNGMRAYQATVKQKLLEEQQKAEEVARLEREKLEREAQKKRDAEAASRQKAEEAERLAREATNAEERRRLEAIAERAKVAADKAKSEAELKTEVAETVVATVVQTELPKVKGVSTSKNWKVKEITNVVDAINYLLQTDRTEYISQDKNNPGKVIIDFNALAKRVEDKKPIPGIVVFNDENVSYRS